MAILTDTHNKSTALLLEPLSYSEKEESWFVVKFAFLLTRKKTFEVKGSFHINDFVNLIRNIDDLLLDSAKKFEFEPLEPYLKIEIASYSEEYIVTTFLSSGPIFNERSYKKCTIKASRMSLKKFEDKLREDLKEIDSDLIFKSKKL